MVFILIILLSLGGCTPANPINSLADRSRVPQHYNQPPNIDVLSSVTPGKTTKADIRTLLGEPNSISSHPETLIGSTGGWRYTYIVSLRYPERYYYGFDFDKNGILVQASKIIYDIDMKKTSYYKKTMHDN